MRKKLPQSGQALLFQNGQALLQHDSGQALLIVLLSMAVVLTVVLSILSFSVTDIAVTSREEEALRAFSAAEAGVEKALLAGTGATGSFEEASFNAAVTAVGEGSRTFVYPEEVAIGDLATVWFAAHDADGNLVCNAQKPCFTGSKVKVCWGRAGTSATQATTPAVEVSVYYLATPGSYATARIARAALDPNGGRTGTNKFASPDPGTCSIEGVTYAFQRTVDLVALGIPPAVYNAQNGLQYLTVKLLYNTDAPHGLGVDTNFLGNGLLPSQGNKVVSTGTAGEATRKVEVYNLYANLPSIFNSALFVTGGVVK